MAHGTSSTTAINGSADEIAPYPTAPPPRTPAQIAADAALAHQRAAAFVADTSLPVVSPPSYHSNTIASRTQAAGTNIANFDAAFNNNNNHGNNTGSGTNGGNNGNN
ncbi:hypothetical protein DL98DRAFT_576521 [Cadophora sp. DSE1049]|nr:hypothetical protein DL98DRAFT_576521 [Cadophora sp. DSE1049]